MASLLNRRWWTWRCTDRTSRPASLALSLHGMQITGNGGYDLTSKHLHGHLQGNNLLLSKFQTVASKLPNDDATLSFDADANGTVEQPGLKGNVRARRTSRSQARRSGM